MKFLAIVALLVVAASYPTLGAEISQVECRSYQEILQKAIRIKERCGLPAFSDCCQPRSLLPTGIYEIGDVCNHDSRAFLEDFPSIQMKARCDMDTDGGGWIVIQRRVSGGTTNFSRNWETYELGFGNLDGEFWFGLSSIHCLTAKKEVELRIDMQTTTGDNITWTYQVFRVDGPKDNYRLHIGQGEGTTGTPDRLAVHNNTPFSTYDRDNDASSLNCADRRKGGGWYITCGNFYLNNNHGSIQWASLSPLSKVEMKVRPKTCTSATEQCV